MNSRQASKNGKLNRRLSQPEELVAALAPVVSALNELKVRHYVGGSVASSFHGALRSTMDVDIVCELTESHVEKFLEFVSADYYASETAIRASVENKSCFNLIHLPTSFKVDVFLSRGRPFDRNCMDRCKLESLSEQLRVPIATPEDSVIAKLEWYRAGNEVSERQWDDVTRLLSLLGEQADLDYLTNAAASVGVSNLLTRLLRSISGE